MVIGSNLFIVSSSHGPSQWERQQSTNQRNNDMQTILRYWLPLTAYCAFIFIQSAYATPDVVPRLPYMDKLLHTGGYALLGILFCRVLHTYPFFRNKWSRLVFIGTILTGLYGVSDEWHQSFVAERTADGLDVVADFVGGLIGSALFILLIKSRKRYLLIDKIALFF